MSSKATHWLKRLAKGLAALLLLLGLVLTALGLWLAGPGSGPFIVEKLNGLMAETGLQIEVESLEFSDFFGPLPQNIRVAGFSLSDQAGPFLTVGGADVKLKLFPLLHGQVVGESVRIQAPAFYRPPDIPESAENQAPPSTPNLYSLPKLPVAFKVEQLQLEDGLFDAGFIVAPATGGGVKDVKPENPAAETPVVSENLPAPKNPPVANSPAGPENPVATQNPLAPENPALGQKAATANGNFPPEPGLLWKVRGQGRASYAGGRIDGELVIRVAEPRPEGYSLNAEARLASPASGLLGGVLRGTAGWGGQEFPYLLDIAEQVAGPSHKFTLQNFSLDALGLKLAGRTELELEPLSLRGTIRLQGLAGGEWEAVLNNLAGLHNSSGPEASGFGGDIDLNAEFALPPALFAGAPGVAPDNAGASDAAAEENLFLLTMRGQELRWPEKLLAELFGPEFSLKAQLRAGVTPQGISALHLQLEELRAGLVSGQGEGHLSNLPHFPDSGPLQFSARADLRLADFAPLAGLSGPLAFKASAEGRADEFKLDVLAESPQLEGPGGKFTQAALRVEAVAAATSAPVKHSGKKPATGPLDNPPGNPPGNPPDKASAIKFSGTLSAGAASSPAGPLSLRARWQAEPMAPDMRFAVEGLEAQGAGLDLRATLAVEMNTALPQGAEPRLNGNLSAEIADWAGLGALLNQPLRGGRAGLELRLANSATGKTDGGGQRLDSKLEISSLLLDDGGEEPTLAINKLTGKFATEDLFKLRGLDAALQAGAGSLGPLLWQKLEGKASGNAESGEFSLYLRDSAPARGAGKGGSFDRLGLAGAYALKSAEIELKTFSLNLPEHEVGCKLAAPARIGLAGGFSLQETRVNFAPGGSLWAVADIKANALKAEARLKDIPLGIAGAFTSAPLPSGRVNLDIRAENAGRGLNGGATLELLLSGSRKKQEELGFYAQADLRPGPLGELAGLGLGRGGGLWLNGQGRFGKGARKPENAHGGVPGPDGAGGPDGPDGVDGATSQAGVATDAARNVLLAAPSGEGAPAFGQGQLLFSLPLRMGEGGLPGLDQAAPFAGKLNWRGPIENLWQAVPLPDRYLSGPASIDFEARGNLQAPRLKGSVFLANGVYEDRLLGVLLNKIQLEAASRPDLPLKALLSAEDGKGGTLALEAALYEKAPPRRPAKREDPAGAGKNAAESALPPGPASAPVPVLGPVSGQVPEKAAQKAGGPYIAVRGQITHLAPLQRADLSIMLSGIFGVNGPVAAPNISANLEVERGIFEIIPGAQASIATLEIGEEAPPEEMNLGGPQLDVTLNVPKHFFIRGMGLESEWEGHLKLHGSTRKPLLTGVLRPVRGYLDLLSKSFAFNGGEITFVGGNRINPAINLELVYKYSGFEAVVKAGGTARKPKLAITSRPVYPQDEVLARVLFGKSTSDLSRFEMIQLASSARELTNLGQGSLLSNSLASVRKGMGLDVLRVGSSDNVEEKRSSSVMEQLGGVSSGKGQNSDQSTPTLEAGKYVSDSIYVGVEQGATQDSTGVRVEVELMPNLTLEGRSNSKASEVGIGWKMDY